MAAENSNFVQPTIPRFDGHYDHWSMLMEKRLRSKEYWIPKVVAGVKPIALGLLLFPPWHLVCNNCGVFVHFLLFMSQISITHNNHHFFP
jgi:hypothetical protein